MEVSTVIMCVNKKPSPPLTQQALRRQSGRFRGRGGVSEENLSWGFRPAFLDTESGTIYLARFSDGRPAPLHVLDGLPDELVVERRESGSVTAVKDTVQAGFTRRGRFYTRERAAQVVQRANRLLKRFPE